MGLQSAKLKPERTNSFIGVVSLEKLCPYRRCELRFLKVTKFVFNFK